MVALASDGTVSIAAARVRLLEVLNEIARRTRIRIVVDEVLEDARVSLQLRGVALEEAMKQLLQPYDTFVLHSAPETSGASSIRAIWIYSRGDGLDLEPLPPKVWASTRELEEQLEDPDPGQRADAYEALIERLGDRGLAAVTRGLSDLDDSVRLMALSMARSEGVQIPSSELLAIVQSDASSAVRRMALQEAEGRPEAIAIANSVKDDPDDDVRREAMAMLATLEARVPRKPQ
jgi:hypothetical protein